MDSFTPADCEYMARAMQLARRGVYTAHPNPRVGCVLVKDDRIIGEGWHRKTGEAHAEVAALEDAGGAASGATVYVTLEPCSHQGKTPPCADALIAAGVKHVVAAMEDPNTRVSGNGHGALEDAGISVRTGLLQDQAAALNPGFLSRMQRGRPFVRLKIAASLDGRTAMASGESQWISGEAARDDVQRLRASSGAVMVGVDSKLKMPASARLLGLPGATAVFCTDDAERSALEAAGASIHVVAGSDAGVDLAAVTSKLGELEINDVLVEAGPTLAGSMLASDLVDELVIYQAPHIMGSETRGMFTTPDWETIKQRLGVEIVDVRKIGADLRITAKPDR
jgi:diaminohydroxyphosphoribosylaminopyrimidine deaminase/5-amino-6-(5-phosphoribosylamino)uracil reductase